MQKPERTGDSPLQILLVDDDFAVLEALERGLGDEPDLQVVGCSTFDKARKLLREQPFDVLITDVRLGAFNGLQLAVLARDVNPLTRLIVFSGFDDNMLRAEAAQLGATYVVKPVPTEQLKVLIRKK